MNHIRTLEWKEFDSETRAKYFLPEHAEFISFVSEHDIYVILKHDSDSYSWARIIKNHYCTDMNRNQGDYALAICFNEAHKHYNDTLGGNNEEFTKREVELLGELIEIKNHLYNLINSLQDKDWVGRPENYNVDIVGYAKPYYDINMKQLINLTEKVDKSWARHVLDQNRRDYNERTITTST